MTKKDDYCAEISDVDTVVIAIGVRANTVLVGFEMLILFLIGFLPLSVPVQIVQVLINFICSMQYNTFRQAEGIPMATTFVTNHIRQIVKERIEDDANEKAALKFSITALSFASISIFPG